MHSRKSLVAAAVSLLALAGLPPGGAWGADAERHDGACHVAEPDQPDDRHPGLRNPRTNSSLFRERPQDPSTAAKRSATVRGHPRSQEPTWEFRKALGQHKIPAQATPWEALRIRVPAALRQ